jgi:hypothetical protein
MSMTITFMNLGGAVILVALLASVMLIPVRVRSSYDRGSTKRLRRSGLLRLEAIASRQRPAPRR